MRTSVSILSSSTYVKFLNRFCNILLFFDVLILFKMAKKRATKRKATTNTAVENDENHEESQPDSVENDAGSSKSTPGKKKKSVTTKEQKNETSKNKAKSSKSKSDEEDEEEPDYEVEKVIDVNYKKNGKREFLIRWKNFSSKHDTWEPEENLSCDELIRKFLEAQEETNTAAENDENHEESQTNNVENGVGSSKSATSKKKKSVTSKTEQKNGTPKTKAKSSKSKSDDEGEEKEEDYEVEKIIDVNYKKSGKREFLIRWKNFSSKHDTWEPEDNLSCDELITKFLEVQEQRDKQPRKDLREHPKSVSRYAAPIGRKSKRTAGARKSYTEREDEDDD